VKDRGGRKKANISLSAKFIEAARKLGCDEDPAHFDEILKKSRGVSRRPMCRQRKRTLRRPTAERATYDNSLWFVNYIIAKANAVV
jgi:hypothetical protein